MIRGFHSPTSPAGAARLRAELGAGAWFLGGGTELNSLNPPAGAREHLIDLQGLGLRTIEPIGDEVRLGASCTLQELVESPVVPAVVRSACRHVNNRTIRNQATLGGQIAAAQPSASVLPILIALGTHLELVAADGSASTVPIERRLASSQHELITAARVPAGRPGHGAAVAEHRRSANDLAMLTVAVSLELQGGLVTASRVVVGGVVALPTRLVPVEQLVTGHSLPADTVVSQAVAAALETTDDARASAELKRHLAGVLVARTLRQARAEATEATS